MPRILLKERGAFGNADTSGAWLSSARALEEGEDDVKSSCPLYPGRHTCYNGQDKGSQSREVNSFPGLVHTTRHTMGAGHAQSRYLNCKEGDAEGRAGDWSEVVTRSEQVDRSSFFHPHPCRHTGATWVGEDRWGDSGEIQCRSNFLFTRGIRAIRGDHYGSSLLENSYIPYQYMDSYLSSTGLGLASMEKNGAPNNVSSQTKNYEIAPFILG
ncbi:hypothetical protein DEO72_LG11g757 [Vigna unguiculata]|uniref:Uncharacterized protein ycf68 n=1 Tax=Vigna unguiculata TaxID=3917 RepID=A0A4D6NMF9_VIGUN|nr:hypothetical protein DEO72_LG11g757 [Vigna unguiculata]